MRISIFGMGYVGVASGAGIAALGNEVIGVDVNPNKVQQINDGIAPIVEDGIAELVRKEVQAGRLRAVQDVGEAISGSDVSLISVGTPSTQNGSLSLAAMDVVLADIGAALRAKRGPHTVIVRSTVAPGTTEEHIAPRLSEAAGRNIGADLTLGCNPEFLREGSSISDFQRPPYTIVGMADNCSSTWAENLYGGLEAPLVRTSCRLAEAVKFLSNNFHALKISFANEVGSLLKICGVDGREAMQVFCQDSMLNISPAYLRPGYAFGGSCLPKDLRAFLALARDKDVELPLLSTVLASNERHIERAFALATRGGRRPITLLGLAFKPGTDDLRESPLVALAEKLIGKGYSLKIYDAHVQVSRLIGANRAFIDREIPHLERLLVEDLDEGLATADVVIVGHIELELAPLVAAGTKGKTVIDLQGVPALESTAGIDYEGICW